MTCSNLDEPSPLAYTVNLTQEKHILLLCSSDYSKQPRVLRTIEALRNYYQISIASYVLGKSHDNTFIKLSDERPIEFWHFNKPAFIRLPVSLFYRVFKHKWYSYSKWIESAYWTKNKKQDVKELQKKGFHLVIVHGIDLLPFGAFLTNAGIPLIFNTHEYYPLEFEQDPTWLKTIGRRNHSILKRYLPKVKTLFTVSEGIREKYRSEFGKDSIVITNAAPFQELVPGLPDASKIKLVHHGIANREREIEKMAELIHFLPNNYEIHFVLTPGDKGYLEEIKEQFSSNGRIKFHEPVPINALCAFLNQFDIGYYILPPVNFNTKHALPNKFFEFVQARLCLVFAPLVEIKPLIDKYEIGVVSVDFSTKEIANCILGLSVDDIYRCKQNAHKYAREFSSEKNTDRILSQVKDLIGS